MQSAPIGVFDSGVGGLSILSGLHALLPNEHLVYLADSAHAPYGPKGGDFIRARCDQIMDYFLQLQVKAVVVACNTATAAAIAGMRERYTIPLIGVEPAVKPAAESSASGIVGVLATSGTISSDKFLKLQDRFTHQAEIITRACPGLVELIEAPVFDERAIVDLLNEFIGPMLAKGADTLVLGCTHYSLIRALIQAVAGETVTIVDAGQAVARETGRRLQDAGRQAALEQTGSIRFATSGNPQEQQALFARYWGQPVPVGHIAGDY